MKTVHKKTPTRSLPVVSDGEVLGNVITRRDKNGRITHKALDIDGQAAGDACATWMEARQKLLDLYGVGPAGPGRIRTMTGLWELRGDNGDGDVVAVGDTVQVWRPGGRCEPGTVEKLLPPHKPSSQGKIEYRDTASGNVGGCYVSVVNARWVCLEGDAVTWR